MNVVLRTVLLRSKADAGSTPRKVHQPAPNQRRNEDTLTGIVHMQEQPILTIVNLNVETPADGKQHHLAGPMSMIATHVVTHYVVTPKDAPDGKRNVPFRLTKSQTATRIRNLRKANHKATFRKQSSNIRTHLS